MTFAQSLTRNLGPEYLFKFRGRASRSEYWWFLLFIFLVDMGLVVLIRLLPEVGVIINFAIGLILLPPNIGVTVRRLHDRNLSGWWLLIPLLMLFLWLATGGKGSELSNILSFFMGVGFLIILLLPGTPGPNRFGPSPILKT